MYNSFLLNKRVFEPIRELLIRSTRGIVYTGKTFERVKERLLNLSNARGFNTALEFYSILYDLSIADEQRLLTSASYDSSLLVRESRSRRIEKICKYIEVNFKRILPLKK